MQLEKVSHPKENAHLQNLHDKSSKRHLIFVEQMSFFSDSEAMLFHGYEVATCCLDTPLAGFRLVFGSYC